MNMLKNVDISLQDIGTSINEDIVNAITTLAQNPELSQITGAAIMALPLMGLTLKTHNKENTFILYAISRLMGTLILYGILGAMILAAAGFFFTYLGDLNSDYEYYSEAYSRAFKVISKTAIEGGLVGGVIAALFFVFSRTIYTKFLANVEARLTWSTVSPSGVPTENDIKLLKIRNVSQSRLKGWLKRAHSSQKIFIGIENQTAKPIFIPLNKALADCWQVSGQPGAGKGVFNQLLFSQFIKFKHVNIVFNPKKDDYARSALFRACQESSLPFYRLDLTQKHASISALNGCNSEEAFEVLCSGFGYEDTNKESSFYSAVARRIIREVTEHSTPKSIPEFLQKAQPIFAEAGKDAASLSNKLTELALLKANQTEDASPLLDVFQRGGCLLIEGTPNNQSVLTLMKMLHVRVVQLASSRHASDMPVNIWLDEAKYVLCPSVINGLGTSRSFNFRYSIATQSNSDYETAQLPYSPEAARKIINDDTPLRIIYSSHDHDTAESISKHCGTHEGIISSNSTSINELATETSNGERRVSKSEEPIFHPNIIKAMPKGMAIITGAVPWPILASIPALLLVKSEIPAYQAPPLTQQDNFMNDGDELL